MHIRLIPTLFLVFLLSACSQPASSGAAPLPLQSNATNTLLIPVGGAALTPTSAPKKSIGTPVPGWENIPIMPGAYDPELEEMVYLYSVDSPVEEVESFYQAKMEVNGWSTLNRQVMEASASSGPSTILDYQKNDQSLNVMLVALPDGTSTTVILSRLGP